MDYSIHYCLKWRPSTIYEIECAAEAIDKSRSKEDSGADQEASRFIGISSEMSIQTTKLIYNQLGSVLYI